MGRSDLENPDVRAGSPLQLSTFRRVWAGATLSSAGDAASWIALVALALGSVHASLPLLAALYTAPVAIGGLASGWALDRFDRRLLLIADSLLRGAVFATIPLAAALGHLTPAHLYLVAASYGALKMTSLAGFPSVIPSIVPPAMLSQANALEGVSFGLASLTGAALAGVAVASVGPAPVVAFDAATYFGFALALASVRFESAPDPSPAREPRRQRGSGFGPILRAAVSHPWLRDLTVMFALFNIGAGALLVVLPHRAIDLGLGAAGYGWFVAAMTGGELVASAVLVRGAWRYSLPVSIVVAQLAAALFVLGLLTNTVMVFVCLFAFGVCTAPMTAWAQTLRMTAVPAAQRGRLFALLRTLMQATPPLGAGLAGASLPHGNAITLAAVIAIMGVPALLLAPDLLRYRQ